MAWFLRPCPSAVTFHSGLFKRSSPRCWLGHVQRSPWRRRMLESFARGEWWEREKREGGRYHVSTTKGIPSLGDPRLSFGPLWPCLGKGGTYWWCVMISLWLGFGRDGMWGGIAEFPGGSVRGRDRPACRGSATKRGLRPHKSQRMFLFRDFFVGEVLLVVP